MMTQIVSLSLAALSAALTALPVDVAHHHCDDVTNPLCVPKGAVPHADEDVVVDVALRGSGRDKEPGTQQG